MALIIAVFSMFCSVLCVQAEPVLLSPARAECARADLQGKVEEYLDALRQGDPSRMSLASGAKYIENRKESSFGEGIWRKALKIDFSRSVLDVETCESFTEIIHANGSHPSVLGTRLKIEGSRISEVETLVTDQDDWLFNAANYLKYSSQEKWDLLPEARRSDRQTLIKAANAYFDVFLNPSSPSDVPWGIPCARLEGGAYTNPTNDPKASCTGGPPLEGSVKISNRRFIVDPDMGTVVGLADFGEKNGWPDSHMFRLENGKLRYVHTLTVCPEGCELPSSKEGAKSQ